jgi:hypothetical protein
VTAATAADQYDDNKYNPDTAVIASEETIHKQVPPFMLSTYHMEKSI